MFLETPRFPDEIAFNANGGVSYSTYVIQTTSGQEKRNQMWEYGKGVWDISEALRTIDSQQNGYNLKILRDFFRAVKGKTYGFRFKDFTDYKDEASGILNTNGIGNGIPPYQMVKNYLAGSFVDQRLIQKPVSGTIVVQRNGSPVTVGGAAGNIAIDYTTGIVTFVADATSSATAITPGATTSVSLTTNPGTLTAGKLLYLSGFTGADASLVNGKAHIINSVSGSGPFTFVLATNTAGKTITVGTGLGSKFPQATETLAWTGQFDVPCRFDSDNMMVQMTSGGLYQWSGLALIELRI